MPHSLAIFKKTCPIASLFIHQWHTMRKDRTTKPSDLLQYDSVFLAKYLPCPFMLWTLSLYPFSNIKTILSISAIFPVTSAQCERCMSVLWLVKTCLWSIMGQDRFTALSLMYIHRHMDINSYCGVQSGSFTFLYIVILLGGGGQ